MAHERARVGLSASEMLAPAPEWLEHGYAEQDQADQWMEIGELNGLVRKRAKIDETHTPS